MPHRQPGSQCMPPHDASLQACSTETVPLHALTNSSGAMNTCAMHTEACPAIQAVQPPTDHLCGAAAAALSRRLSTTQHRPALLKHCTCCWAVCLLQDLVTKPSGRAECPSLQLAPSTGKQGSAEPLTAHCTGCWGISSLQSLSAQPSGDACSPALSLPLLAASCLSEGPVTSGPSSCWPAPEREFWWQDPVQMPYDRGHKSLPPM